jgi:outer membrane protein assembly factor BamD (BamD/ComL family)
MASSLLERFSADFITRTAERHDRCTFAALYPILYHKGYAQIQLKKYEDAIDTFDLYLRRYPFGSVEGATGYVRDAKAALKKANSWITRLPWRDN